MRLDKLAVLAAAASGLWPCLAAAQSQEAPPVVSPIRVESDHNGVNVATGRTTVEGPVLSVPAAPNLAFDRVQNAAPYVIGRITGSGSSAIGNYNVHTGAGASESFRCVWIVCDSVTGTGSVYLIHADPALPDERQYRQAGTGARYYFDKLHYNGPSSNGRLIQYYGSRVVWPNGEIITYTYDIGGLTGLAQTFYRPRRIASNRGYHIDLTYPVQYMEEGEAAWRTPNTATLFRTAEPGAPPGDPGVPLRRFTYNGNNVTDSGSTIADLADDRTYICSSCGGTLGANVEAAEGTLRLPGEGSAAVEVIAGSWQNSPLVQTVRRDGVPWTYSYANPHQAPGSLTWLYSSVTVTGPNGFNQVYHTGIGGPPPSGQFNTVTGITDSLGRTTSYVIDPVTFRPNEVTYPQGNKVSVTYDQAGNVTARTMHAAQGSGTSPATITERAHYTLPASPQFCDTACWRPTWSKDGLERQTDYAYNAAGQLIQQDDPADADNVRRRTIIEYVTSAAGISRRSVVRVCGVPAGGGQGTCGTNQEHRTEYQYWGDTNLVTVERRIDGATGAALETVNAYDVFGRLVSSDGPLPGTADATYIRYDAHGRKSWEIGAADASGVRPAARTYYRESDDKVLVVERGTIPAHDGTAFTYILSRTETVYDGRRNPAREVLSQGGTFYNVVDRSFDDRGQLLCEATRMNHAAFLTVPAACVLGVQGTGANDFGPDRIVRNVYDLAGQRIQRREGVGTAVEAAEATWAYNLNGQVTTVIDGNGNRAELRYDGHMRQDRWTFPSATRAAAYNDATQASALASAGAVNPTDYEGYGYDAAGNRTSLRKRDGTTLTFTFDNLDRMIARIVPERPAPHPYPLTAAQTRDVHYGYDLRNLQLYARYDGPTGEGVTNAYDAFGRQTSATLLMDVVSRTLSYRWDAGSRRTRVAHPDGYFSSYAYDPAGRLTGVYHANGALLQVFVYDVVGRLSVTARAAGNGTSYRYDGLSRLDALTHDLPGTSADLALGFAFNPAGQIARRTQSNDIYAWSGHYAVNRGYTTNGLNQYTAAGTAAFAYDANGNLTSDGSTAFTYDVENRLVAASGARTAALRYDPLGRLYEVTPSTGSGGPGGSGTTRFLYDGDALVADYDAAGVRQNLYVHAGGADTPFIWYTPADIRFLHTDQQGSIVAVSSLLSNTVVGVNSYDEYGIPAAGNVGRFQYTGQAWLAELGMYHYKARIYSPTLGRFLQTDPVGYQDQFNLYAYVGNDPVNASDPSGAVICSNNTAQCEQVHEAAREARGAVLQASSDLRGIAGAMRNGTELTAEQEAMVSAFERRFGAGSATSSNLGSAARHFDRVANRIGEPGHGLNVHFRTASQMGNAIASAQGNALRIGPRFFGTDSDRGGMSQAFVIMHEGGHEAGRADQILPPNAPLGIGRTALGHRRAYGIKATDWLGIHAPNIAARNNDSYNCFVMPACGGP